MTENLQLQPIDIQHKIYEIRGQKVMLDFDLAEMYQTETKRLKEAVRRNIERFPADFMFELTSKEWEILRTQFATSSWGGARYQPFAFTEQGVAMLGFNDIYQALTEMASQKENKPLNPVGFLAYNKE